MSPSPPSDLLLAILKRGRGFAIPGGSEKARSEFIVAPILAEVQQRFSGIITIYSGCNLDVEKEKGLAGECDFLLGRGINSLALQAPLLTVVEAKRNDIDIGLGQCVAQMVGVQRFNQNYSESIDPIFGCITTGEIWQFLRLSDSVLTIDSDRFYLGNLEKILGCLSLCLDGGGRSPNP